MQQIYPDAVLVDVLERILTSGGEMPTFTLNFSRLASPIVAQYYNFLRLGVEGYKLVHGYSREVAMYLSDKIAALGPFELADRQAERRRADALGDVGNVARQLELESSLPDKPMITNKDIIKMLTDEVRARTGKITAQIGFSG